ncbi:MAG: hypothetical protein ABWY06_07955 [Pseudomonas sp.]|uniref:hypothetical protein n=1 Tax=Pseudomonas sp. TaxID=306 RepID=UPI00339AAB33
MNPRRLLWLCALLAGLWLIWPALRPSAPVPGAPQPLASGAWRVDQFTLTALEPFALEGRVLGREDYRFDPGARLSPTDLVMGWGPMADPQVLQHLRISQSNRWYFWRAESLPIPRREIETHSANMHFIPANAAAAAALANTRSGQRIRFSGQLVSVQGDDGFTWVSSRTRDDTGNGACELIWLEQLTPLE